MNKIITIILALFMMMSMVSCTNTTDENNTIPTVTETIEIVFTKPIETEPTVSEETVPETEPIIFSEDITFTYEYVSEEDVMPYGLFTPSTSNNNEKIPLIVWLHGSGEKNVSKETFLKRGLPYVLNNWTLEGFNTYVLCPQLTGQWNPGAWYLPDSKENLQILIDKFISEYNVDTNNIIITGHSLGGQGAMYMAHELPEYFSKLVVLSGYGPNIDITEITIPTIGYVGMNYYGEDPSSVRYMYGSFAPVFGKENTIWMKSSHGDLPRFAFNEDKDENGRSDLIEWMLIG